MKPNSVMAGYGASIDLEWTSSYIVLDCGLNCTDVIEVVEGKERRKKRTLIGGDTLLNYMNSLAQNIPEFALFAFDEGAEPLKDHWRSVMLDMLHSHAFLSPALPVKGKLYYYDCAEPFDTSPYGPIVPELLFDPNRFAPYDSYKAKYELFYSLHKDHSSRFCSLPTDVANKIADFLDHPLIPIDELLADFVKLTGVTQVVICGGTSNLSGFVERLRTLPLLTSLNLSFHHMPFDRERTAAQGAFNFLKWGKIPSEGLTRERWAEEGALAFQSL